MPTTDEILKRKQEVSEAKQRRRNLLPEPETGVNSLARAIAETLAQQSSNKLVVQYLRNEPFLGKVNKKLNTGKKQYRFQRGAPVACLVAFVHEGKAYIGWAKRHPAKEDLNFTKPRARYVAVLRGLTDGIVFNGSGKSAVTSTGEVIPSKIAKSLAAFYQKASKYIPIDFVNVDTDV